MHWIRLYALTYLKSVKSAVALSKNKEGFPSNVLILGQHSQTTCWKEIIEFGFIELDESKTLNHNSKFSFGGGKCFFPSLSFFFFCFNGFWKQLQNWITACSRLDKLTLQKLCCKLSNPFQICSMYLKIWVDGKIFQSFESVSYCIHFRLPRAEHLMTHLLQNFEYLMP